MHVRNNSGPSIDPCERASKQDGTPTEKLGRITLTDFIDTTVLACISQGVIKFYGKIGECCPPYLVLPLTVEPSKPRLCHDERFLSLWIRDLPFKLDHLQDLPRYVLPGHFQTTIDDKGGYQHLEVHLHLIFRMESSAYLYHNVGPVVTSTTRSWGLPVSQYIDDRHVSQLFLSGPAVYQPSRQLAQCKQQSLSLYSFSFQRDTWLTLQRVLHSHPLLLNSCVSSPILYCKPFQSHYIIKKEKFKALRDELLESSFAPVKSLQRFAGKALSFNLAIPACKRYVCSAVAKNSKISVPIQGPLRQEPREWTF